MYKIYADDTVIYDSTFEDFKIGKGVITLETNKSGSFVFSVYPDHFYFDKFIRMKTVITVYKSNKITFRGRILSDVTDYWNNKVITCEGELGFFQDSIIRPFDFSGTPEQLLRTFINEHNAQVDEFKRFKIGKITVIDNNNYIARSNEGYETTLENLNSRLLESALGGNFYITHGKDGTDPIPTLNYLADFTVVSSQSIEFGSNLKDYTKTANAGEIATAIIPLGAEIGEAGSGEKLTIASVNNGLDYVHDKTAVALYGWITKVVEWDDVTEAANLKKKAEDYVKESIKQNVTIELTAVDFHLLDRSIESFKLGDYIPVYSKPHNFDDVMLCNKQTIDLLKPDNDTVTLGHTFMTFTEKNSKILPSIKKVKTIEFTVQKVNAQVVKLDEAVKSAEQIAQEALESYQEIDGTVGTITGDMEAIAGAVTQNAKNISANANSIQTNTREIEKNRTDITNNTDAIQSNAEAIETSKTDIVNLSKRVTERDTQIADISEEIEGLSNKVNRHDADIVAISEKVANLPTDVVELSEKVTEQGEQITSMSDTVNKHNEDIATILARLEKLENLDVNGGYPS